MDILSLLMMACAAFALGLFAFIIRFAVKSEVVITTAVLTMVTAAGLFSWAFLAQGDEGADQRPWVDIAYLCSMLMFPLLITLFLQRSSTDYFFLRTFMGRIIIFGPLLAELTAHFLLPAGMKRFSDFIFLVIWLAISFIVWHRLFARMQSTSSQIRRDQLEFMLTSFFSVLLFNVVTLFGLFMPEIVSFGALFSMAIAGSLAVTVRGLVRYQMVIGRELLLRNSLIMMLTAIICVTFFVLAQLFLAQSAGTLEYPIQMAAGTAMIIVIVLSINLISDMSAKIVERISPQLKWQESHVREIYLMNASGMVIAHVGAHEELGEIDKDMVGGMLTAIQNFVREAFHTSEMDSLKSLSMGRLRVLIEAKGDVVMAVLFTGHEARELRRGTVRLLEEIEQRHRGTIRGWNGEKRAVAAIQSQLEEMFHKIVGEKFVN